MNAVELPTIEECREALRGVNVVRERLGMEPRTHFDYDGATNGLSNCVVARALECVDRPEAPDFLRYGFAALVMGTDAGRELPFERVDEDFLFPEAEAEITKVARNFDETSPRTLAQGWTETEAAQRRYEALRARMVEAGVVE